MTYQSAYANRIKNYAHHSMDPRHIEAWMRLERGTLDQLSTKQFIDEVIMAERCVLALRRSKGLLTDDDSFTNQTQTLGAAPNLETT